MTKIIIFLLVFSMNSFAREIKIINWNVYLLPKIAKNTAQDERVQLIADYLLNSSEDFDIITLQEVFTKNGYKTLVETLKDKYPYHTGSPIRKWFKPVNSGLLILSKYPIKETSFYMYSGMAHADRFSSKGVLATTIEIQEGYYAQVATTHLQAQSGAKYERIRETEYKYIKKEVIEGFKVSSMPMILTGDFNIDKHYPSEYEKFINFMGLETPSFSSDEQFTVNSKTNTLVEPSKDRPLIQEVLDYTFLLEGEYNEQILDSYILRPKGDYIYQDQTITAGSLSDHFPVITIIKL